MTDSASVRRPHVDYPPIPNGMDYLDSVVDHLSGEPKPRDLKYAVLHLQAAAEVLLKARLLQEHWSLVFKDPGRADRSRFESGDFESCGTAEAVSRLRNIVGVDLPKAAIDEINQLAKWRNALQHYGVTVPAPAVESRAARILDFLLLFIAENLLPGLSGRDAMYAGEGEYHIRARLTDMRAVIKARMDRVRPVIASVAERTVECPECGQLALVVGSSPLQCRFCDEEHRSAVGIAEFYVGVTLGKEWEPGYEDSATWPIETCPDCTEHALVLETETAAAPGRHTPLCFACGTVLQNGGG
ncbi:MULTISPECIES: hypothetical protein [unclassified Streptomyces]|uniref:hypothetical protein n=1 Tax=unclassified Streptomyces TaxID=2593676 RepID=UPI0036546212